MTNKSIHQVELDTTQFDAFHDKFKAYQATLDEMPQKWRAAAQAAKGGTAVHDQLATAVKEHNQSADLINKGKQEEREKIEAVVVSWEGLYHYSRAFADNIHSATFSLARWTALTSVFSGILGAGGLFGIERLAMGVSHARTESAGFANKPGEQAAFEASFARLGDPNSILSWVNEMQTDPNKLGGLQAIMGSRPAALKILGEDTAPAFVDMLGPLKAMVDSVKKNSPGQFDTIMQMYNVPLGLARVVEGMSAADIATMVSGYQSSAKQLDLPPAVLRKWNDLNSTIELAGGTIETAFTNRIVVLTPGISALAKSFGHLITYLLRDGGPLSKWMKMAGSGLQEFSDSLTSNGFNNIVNELIMDMDAFADVINALILHPLDALESYEKSLVTEGFEEIGVGPKAAKAAAKKLAPFVGDVAHGAVGAVRDAYGLGKAGLSATNDALNWGLPYVGKALRVWWHGEQHVNAAIGKNLAGLGGVKPHAAIGHGLESLVGVKLPVRAGSGLINLGGAKPPANGSPPASAPPNEPIHLPAFIDPAEAAPLTPAPLGHFGLHDYVTPSAAPTSLSRIGLPNVTKNLHPAARHNARERAKPKVTVTAPSGMSVTTNYPKHYLHDLLQ